MDATSIYRHIAMLREGVSGEFSSATRVVDALLDLRLLSQESPVVVELIDSTLVDVPGWFVATNAWWADQLDRIERLVLTEDSNRSTSAPR